MNRGGHCTEEDLIAWQLGETSGAAVKAHLEQCPGCAAEAEAIAETLRVFSAGPVPRANLDHAWQRLRGNLPALAATRKPVRRKLWAWAVPALAASGIAASVLAGSFALRHRAPVPQGAAVAGVVLHGAGPISAEPEDPATAEHLASAERLLTEVSHAGGKLNGSTRTEAHELLLSNALYIQKAQGRGDTPEAAVLENLGRTLTTLDHEPADGGKGWHLRLEMNTDGVLLDLRILQQNDRMDAAAGKQSQPSGKDSQ